MPTFRQLESLAPGAVIVQKYTLAPHRAKFVADMTYARKPNGVISLKMEAFVGNAYFSVAPRNDPLHEAARVGKYMEKSMLDQMRARGISGTLTPNPKFTVISTSGKRTYGNDGVSPATTLPRVGDIVWANETPIEFATIVVKNTTHAIAVLVKHKTNNRSLSFAAGQYSAKGVTRPVANVRTSDDSFEIRRLPSGAMYSMRRIGRGAASRRVIWHQYDEPMPTTIREIPVARGQQAARTIQRALWSRVQKKRKYETLHQLYKPDSIGFRRSRNRFRRLAVTGGVKKK